MGPLSVVIPSYNEEDRLPPTLDEIGRYLAGRSHWLPAELIVVDDGSSDRTTAAAGAVAMPLEVRLVVLSHGQNLGKGAAVRTGFRRAAGAQILLSDADLSAPIEELETLAGSAPETTVRVGSRALDRELITVRQPVYRDFMGRIFNLAVRTLVLPGIHDTQCGFKLFPGDLGRALAAVQRINGFAFDVELMFLARRWGTPVVEVPVHWRHVEASRVQPGRHSMEMLRDLLRLWGRGLIGDLPAPPSGGGGYRDRTYR
jgi:dolichyl-phosphate beta-glucosyltransferase